MATKNPFQGDDVDPFSAVRDESGAIRREAPKPAAKQSFGQAFAAARRAGKDDFTWNGKRYTTEMAKPTAKPAAKSAPADTRRAGPTRERAADMPPMARRPDASTSRGVRAADTSAAKAKPASKTPARTGVQARADADRAARDARYEFGRQRKAERDSAASDAKVSAVRNKISKGMPLSSSERVIANNLGLDSRKKAADDARKAMSPAQRSAARGQRIKEFFGAPKKMAKGGSVRGSGIATQGVRKAKMM